MPLRDVDERAALRRQRDQEARRAEKRAHGLYTREDRSEHVTTTELAPSLSFTITQDVIECRRCLRPAKATTSTSGPVYKLWRCEFCLWKMSGQYTTYLIEEEPG